MELEEGQNLEKEKEMCNNKPKSKTWGYCSFFNTFQGCRNGTNCKFVHDTETKQNSEKQPRPCPNDGCKNFCFGRQCKHCHSKMIKERQITTDQDEDYQHFPKFKLKEKQKEYHYRRTHLKICTQCNLNKCMGIRCRQCHFSV